MNLAYFNLALLCITTYMLHYIFKRLSGELASTLSMTVFLALFCFGNLLNNGNYNFVLPYSNDLTRGFLIAIISIVFAYKFIETKNFFYLSASGIFYGMTLLTKPEMVLSCSMALFIIYALNAINDFKHRNVVFDLLILFISVLIPILIAWLMLSTAMPYSVAFKNLISPFLFAGNSGVSELDLYRDVIGTLNLGLNLRTAATIFLGYFLVLGLLFACCFFIRFDKKILPYLGVILFTIPIVMYFQFQLFFLKFAPGLGSPFPLFMIISLFFAVTAYIREKKSGIKCETGILRIGIIVFALSMMIKIFFNVKLAHYGFVLAAPALLVFITDMFYRIPSHINSKGGSGVLFAAGFIGLVCTIVMLHLSIMEIRFQSKPYILGTGVDAYHVDKRGIVMGKYLEEIGTIVKKNETVLVVPGAVCLSYLSRIQNGTRYICFSPTELVLYGENTIISDLAAHPPDYIALESSMPQFGSAFGKNLLAWIRKNYAMTRLFSDDIVGPDFQIALLKKS